MDEEDAGWQRLDKFLFYARFCKTLAVAAALVERGHLRINRQVTEKPHARLRLGDVLTLPLTHRVVVIEVVAFANRRESAPLAQALYKEIISSAA